MDQSVQDLSPLFLSVFTGAKIIDSEPLMVEMQDGPDSRASARVKGMCSLTVPTLRIIQSEKIKLVDDNGLDITIAVNSASKKHISFSENGFLYPGNKKRKHSKAAFINWIFS